MNKRKNLSIRKFSLFAAIGLIFLILSNIFVKAYPNPEKTEFILIAVSQVIGNIAFGIGLIGYFLHLKHNRLLKWTSLFVGTFYILNLMAPDSVLPVVLDEFNGLDKNLVLVYTIVIEIIMIFFGLTFTKLSTFSRTVGFLSMFYIMFAAGTFVLDIVNITIDYNPALIDFFYSQNIDYLKVERISIYGRILSYVALLAIFIFLYFRQRNHLNTVFNIKNLETPNPKELKKMEKELKQLEEEHKKEMKKES